MLTRYGIDVLIGVAIAILLIIGIAIWTDERWLRILLYAIAAFLSIFALITEGAAECALRHTMTDNDAAKINGADL